jgi:hypothetical protein
MPLPERPDAQPPAPPPAPPQAPAPRQQAGSILAAPPPNAPESDANWHRFHYPIGIFLVAYGVAGVLLLAIGWDERHREMTTYLSKTIGLNIATPALITTKVVEVLLTLLALAGLLRRRDVWYLPAIFGWIAGFAAFCVLDVWSRQFGGLAEHFLYLIGFVVLLVVSFALGVRTRVARAERGPIAASPGSVTASRMKLTRTQEMALAALNRWQRTASRANQLPPR